MHRWLATPLTLRSDENERDFGRVPKVRHFGVVAVDGVERRLVLEAEHEDDGVHPRRELKHTKQKQGSLKLGDIYGLERLKNYRRGRFHVFSRLPRKEAQQKDEYVCVCVSVSVRVT